ncbi:MAG: prepilin-type N-terminal cleavage/methylation domain-containing protein [Cyanobacteria bacterium]|nr:prepilin-type N-terminal cleavage/methylation domain-containing protein [Cyanobacteriota bacterium]
MHNQSQKGFTLAELSIVTVVVVLLACLGFSQYNVMVERADAAAIKMNQIQLESNIKAASSRRDKPPFTIMRSNPALGDVAGDRALLVQIVNNTNNNDEARLTCNQPPDANNNTICQLNFPRQIINGIPRSVSISVAPNGTTSLVPGSLVRFDHYIITPTGELTSNQ